MTDRLMYSVFIDKELNPLYINLNDETLKQLNLESNSIILNFGKFKKELTIKIDNNLKPNQIKLPSYLNENISIPELPYDSFFNENHLFLGPVIGFLVTPWYYNNREKMLKLRFSNYDKIKGLIFIFTTEKINQSNKTISGFYYEPTTNKFIKGTFPYPCAIFNRCNIEPNIYESFKKMGVSLFNYPYVNIDKLKFWTLLSKSNDIKDHLPFTQKYTNVNELIKMQSRYPTLYLKPRNLSQGRGIYYLKKVDGNDILVDNNGQTCQITSKEELTQILKDKLNNQYIVQEEIVALDQSERIDFRIYLQKGIDLKWKYTAMVARMAKKDSIITNSSGRQKVMPGELAMKNIFHLDNYETVKKTEEIIQLCINCFNILEQNGYHLGDLAVDFIIDKNKKLWLLEVQINYAAEKKVNWKKSERRILPDILPTPFEYAKGLAGF